MKRFKILAGAALVTLLVLLVIASTKITNTSKTPATSSVLDTIKVDAEKQGLYFARQSKLNEALATYFKKAVKEGLIVGAGVSIVRGDSILVSTGFGKRNVGERGLVNGETIFRLGSLSKGFAGVLMADLKVEGKVDWQDKVTDYIPGFQLGDSLNTSKITISNILSHSSGAPYHSFTNLVEAGLPMGDIAKRFNEVKRQNVPGKQYSYQNAIFALSQEIVREATGEDIKIALQNRFFTPLDMRTASMAHETLLQAQNVALPHAAGNGGWRSLPLKDRYYNAVVAGGIDASVLDMAKWMRFLLGCNPEVLSKSAISEVFKPIIALRDNNKYYQRWPGHQQSAYGHGWRIHHFIDTISQKALPVWHHGGSVNNYRNEIALFPDEDLGICVLLNSNSSLASTVIPDLYGIIRSIFRED